MGFIQHLLWDFNCLILIFISLHTFDKLQLFISNSDRNTLKLASIVKSLVLWIQLSRHQFSAFVAEFVSYTMPQLDVSCEILVCYFNGAYWTSFLGHQTVSSWKFRWKHAKLVASIVSYAGAS